MAIRIDDYLKVDYYKVLELIEYNEKLEGERDVYKAVAQSFLKVSLLLDYSRLTDNEKGEPDEARTKMYKMEG